MVDDFDDRILSFRLRCEALSVGEWEFPLAALMIALGCYGLPGVAGKISVKIAEFPWPSGDFPSRADPFPLEVGTKSGLVRAFSQLFAAIDGLLAYITLRRPHLSAVERDLPSLRSRETLSVAETTGGAAWVDGRPHRRHGSTPPRSAPTPGRPRPLNREPPFATTCPHASPFAPTFGETPSTSRQPPPTLGDPMTTSPSSRPPHRTGP